MTCVVSEAEETPWSCLLCAVTDVPPAEESRVFEVGDRRIALFNVAGVYYAVDDFCTHAQSSLSEDGARCGLMIECGLHRAQFNLETGEAIRGPTRKPLRRYAITVVGDIVWATQAQLAGCRKANPGPDRGEDRGSPNGHD